MLREYGKYREYGEYGGRFVPETLVQPLQELEKGFAQARSSKSFQKSLEYYLRTFVGRPTPLFYARNLSNELGGTQIYFKREDLAHTGSHKINNALGQALLAKQLHKRRLIAETGAGQHGVATATAASLLGLECTVYMGEKDIERQALNVSRMKLLGASVVPVKIGSKTLKEAVNQALREYAASFDYTHYVIGSVVGPRPYPQIVAHFQSVIGKEAKKQFYAATGTLPNYAVACVGGGSNSAGLFQAFENTHTKLIGVEAGGCGLNSGKHSATLCRGMQGVLHGAFSYSLQDKFGQTSETHSIAAGLDYPGVGPLHAFYKDSQRATYASVTDAEAITAFKRLARSEGIIPALESAHAIAYVVKLAKKLSKKQSRHSRHSRQLRQSKQSILVCLSGRGDKDLQQLVNLA